MQHKRLTLFAGHYGSGKTNIAVNYALALRAEGLPVTIADLDIDALECHRAQAQAAVDLDWDGQKAPAFRQARHS